MTIEIKKPELEALILERLKNGSFQNVEDLLLDALQANPERTPAKAERPGGEKSLAQLFAESPFRPKFFHSMRRTCLFSCGWRSFGR
jgi:hypothetical protein